MGGKLSFVKSSKGMTMTELLVVVTIIGLLALLSALALKPWLQLAKARDARRKADVKLISDAVESYAGDHPCYPDEAVINVCLGEGLRPYLNKIPCDPLTNQSYYYVRPDNCKQYSLYADLEIDDDLVDYGVGDYVITSGNLTLPPVIVVTPTPTVFQDCQGGNYACHNLTCRRVKECHLECQPRYAEVNCYGACQYPTNEYNCSSDHLY